jgi:hypothetical protein
MNPTGVRYKSGKWTELSKSVYIVIYISCHVIIII